jgi:hypothetical protein
MKVSNVTPTSTITFNTKDKKSAIELSQWWKAGITARERCGQLLGTAAYLKETQQYRYRQTAIYARLYGNMSLFSFIGSNMSKLDSSSGLPADRPTFNVIQSAADTLVSKLSQSRPQPVFLTDNSDYKERNLAKKLNNFLLGEFYHTKAYDKVAIILRDALVAGTGCLKVYEDQECKVAIERVLLTELLIDPNDGIYGEPRQLYQLKLVDRNVLKESFPGYKAIIEEAAKAYPDNSADSSKTVSDLVMVVEGWHLPSSPDASDGRHTIACSSGIIADEKFEKPNFPFIFLHYSPRLLGFWSQGLAEQLMGTQMEINGLLYTMSRAIKLVGVPRVFQEDGSKVVSSHHNNDVGVIVKFRGTKPSYEVAPCNAPELYEHLQRLITYAYQQCGVSALDASSQKPAGLNSGEAIRTYDDISTDRMAALSRRYDNVFIDLAYAIIDLAKEIAERDKSYTTVYPNKNGIKEVDLPKASLLKNPYVIQCFNQSSLPRDPAGRLQKVTEMIQSGIISLSEGRRLLDYPDLEQEEKLTNAAEERVLQILDKIVEDGQYTAPDPWMMSANPTLIVTQYINLYGQCKLEEEKMQMLRDFFVQCTTLVQAATPPPVNPPQAQPMPQPQSPMVSNASPGTEAV